MLSGGHDAWVMGDAPVVIIDFQGMVDYGKQRCRTLKARVAGVESE